MRRVLLALALSLFLHGLVVFWLSWRWMQPPVLVGGAQVMAVSLASPGSADSSGPGEEQGPQAEQIPEPEPESGPEPELEPDLEPEPELEPQPEFEPVPRITEQPEPVEQPVRPQPSSPGPTPPEPAQALSSGQNNGSTPASGAQAAQASGGESGTGAFGGDYELGQADGPVLLDFAQPIYPPEARRQGLEGRVLLRVLVGAGGKAQEVQVLEASHNLFIEPARQSAFGSTFQPLQVAGQAQAAWVRLPLNFRLTTGQR